MAKEVDTLVSSVKEQWARAWAMWEDMIRSIPDDEWMKGDIDYLIPARHLIHVAVGDDVFSSDAPFDEYDNLQWFGVGEWGTPPGQLPGKGAALEKLADIKATVAARFARLDDAALLEPEQVHPWAGQPRVGKLLYNLRHIQHHLGEVNAELIRRGIKGVDWK